MRQKLTGRLVTPASVAVVALVVVWTALGAAPGPDAKAPPAEVRATPVGVAVAEMVSSIERARVFTGTLVARRRSELAFERPGKLVALEVDEGDRVAEGQLLARLDTRRLTARRKQAEAELVEASSRLRELVFGPRVETIAAARAEVRNLEAQRDVAERRLERRRDLVESRAVSREEFDDVLFDYRAANARVDVGQKALDELEAGTRVEQIDAQRGRVAALEARLADIDHELEDTRLVAPFAGRIAARRLDEGSIVTAGQAVLALIEDEALEAWIGLPPSSAAQLEVGRELTARIGGVAQAASVLAVRPELDPQTRTRTVVLALGSAEGLVAGQVTRIELREPVEMSGAWIPTAALTPDQRGLWSALVVNDEGRVAARLVEVIENDGDRSFVRGALSDGERVIVEGTHRVVPGQAVRIAGD